MIGAPNPDYGTAAAVPESTRLRPHANNSEVRKAAWKLARADTYVTVEMAQPGKA